MPLRALHSETALKLISPNINAIGVSGPVFEHSCRTALAHSTTVKEPWTIAMPF